MVSIIVLSVLSLLASCSSQKYMSEDQSLVKKNTVKVQSNYADHNTKRLISALQYFITQKPNSRILFIPKEYIYLKRNRKSDINKYDRNIRNTFGEEPEFLDSLETQNTAKSMEQFLRYNRGFYNAKVSYDVVTKHQKSEITYHADLGKRYQYGKVSILSKDKQLEHLVDSLWQFGSIQRGVYVDKDRYNGEVNRVTNILQNMGYANFASKYFDIKGDSTAGDHTIDLFIEIYPPDNGTKHQQYTVGKINVYTDFYSRQDTFGLTSTVLNNIRYYKESQKFVVDPLVLDKVILFRKGEVVKKDPRLKTFNKLTSLSTYRFATISPKKNLSDSLIIDYDVLLSTHPRKWTADYGGDLLYSTLGKSTGNNASARGRNVIGLSLSTQLTNRNAFGGSEIYSVTGEMGGQIEITSTVGLRTFNYGLSNYIDFPIFKDHFRQVQLLNSIGLISNLSYRNIKELGTSTASGSFNNTDIRDFYKIFIVNATYGYKLLDKVNRTININTVGITLNDYELRDSFLRLVQDKPLITNTFQDNLFTGFLLRNIFYTYNGALRNSSWQWSLLGNFELSGLEIYGANSLYNAISKKDQVFSLNKGAFQFAKFSKLELDGKLYHTDNRKRTTAFRLNAGLIRTFGDDALAPFIKQFDAGGPNSMRGWAARELGPGASVAPQSSSTSVLPFQKGDIKLETAVEYRFPIYWLFKGAVFSDMGNVWTIKDDGDQGKLTKDFYKQLAISAGWGLRIDFDYFLIRFDFGYKLRSPISLSNITERNWVNWQELKKQKIGNVQVAVNHPF